MPPFLRSVNVPPENLEKGKARHLNLKYSITLDKNSLLTELEKYIGSYFGISQTFMAEVVSFFREEEITKGQYYLRIGQYCDKLSFVSSGFIRIFASTKDKEVTQWITTPGYFITDLNSFVFNGSVQKEMQALTDVQLFTIYKKDYEQLNKVVPNWQRMEKQFIAACFVTLENRIFNHLSMSAAERYDQLLAFNQELFQQVPQQYLASMLGMTPETFSRIRKKKIS